MADQQLQSQMQLLAERVRLAEDVIRQMEDDAVPPAALAAWERYRARYPREDR